MVIDFEVLKKNGRHKKHHAKNSKDFNKDIIGQFTVAQKHDKRGTRRYPSSVSTPRIGK